MIQGISARAMLLYDQGRYDLAEEQTRRWLLDDPDDAQAHALLALCLLKRQDWGQSLREVTEAVRLGPDMAYTHYVAGHVLLAAGRHAQAMNAASIAIRLDSGVPTHHALAATIHLEKRRWRDALAAAETGLAIDPEHVECNNVRAMALVKLGRRAEAGSTMRRTLALDPEDAFSHANQGWTLLHDRKPDEAMQHFREALRIDPTLDWARAGIVEALKARNFVYRWMLAYFLFMSRLGHRAQWGILIGGYVGVRMLSQLGDTHPALQPYTLPVVIIYACFAILSWLAYPLFNLMLRIHRMGRLALSHEQRVAANWVGGVLLVALVALVAHFIVDATILIDVALMSGVLAIPTAALFNSPRGWPQMVMGLAIAGLIAIAATHLWRMAEIAGWGPSILKKDWDKYELLSVYAKGILGATILGNIMAQASVKKG
jgi:tetratricopeptide (TPR) repeat protein